MFEEDDDVTTKRLIKQSNVGIKALKNWQQQPSQNKGYVPFGDIGHAYNMNQDFAPKQAHMQDVAIQPKLEAIRREASKYGDDPFQRNEFLGSGYNFRPAGSFGRDFLSMSTKAKKEIGENETNRFKLWDEYHKLNPYLENKTDALSDMQFGKPGWAQNRKTMVGGGITPSRAYAGYGAASAGTASDYGGGSLVRQLAREATVGMKSRSNYSPGSSYSGRPDNLSSLKQDIGEIGKDLLESPEFKKVGERILNSLSSTDKRTKPQNTDTEVEKSE